MPLRNAFGDIALDSSLQSILTELSAKLEPADLAVLATAARQDAAKSVLDSILGSVDGLEGKDYATQITLAAVLTAIQAQADQTETQPVSAVALPLPSGAASAALQSGRYGGGKTPVVATVTASGDTTIHTPAAGKAVRLFWVSAINDPDEAASPLIKVLLGTTEVYRAFAVAHWEIFEGAVNAPLVINLSGAASVAVTAHVVEF